MKTRADGSPVRTLKGVKSAAPCWWCSRALRGGRGSVVAVDGIPRVVHRDCKFKAFADPDFAGRVTLAKLKPPEVS